MSVVTREINVRNTTEPIGCNGLPYQNINHTKLYYEVTSYSQVELPSCDNGKIDFLTFWFVIDDLCKYNRTSDIYFATIFPNKTSYCPETKNLKKHSPNISLSTAAQLSDNQHVPIYSVDPIKLDTDHGYAIWRPVQQKT
ncbi:unnamed protein product [Adineta steineri]|uniref:Uncharacterized protein n=1 Tax=Adineta steineri TaxID=433720 RepID=A0A814F1E6_9BILA|nr:unnamed protein product [Adineta steineri]